MSQVSIERMTKMRHNLLNIICPLEVNIWLWHGYLLSKGMKMIFSLGDKLNLES